MKNFLFFLLTIFLVCSCDPCIDCPDDCPLECDQTPPVEETKCNLNIKVSKCFNALCQSSEPIEGMVVELYQTEEDAIDAINQIKNATSNEAGEANFINLDCEFVYARVETEDYGTYIGLISLSIVATNNDVIEFVDGLMYQNGSETFISQTHISFENPVISQQSNYARFELLTDVTYSVPEYTDNMLSVKLVDQLDEKTFVVEEKIDRIEGMLQWDFYPQTEMVRNLWTFHEDSITVSRYNDEYFGSFVWHLAEFFNEYEGDSYTFSLIRPTSEIVDMDIDHPSLAPGYGITAAEDYNVFNHLFQNLIIDHRSYTWFDGPQKKIVYNKKDGVVRCLDFQAAMSQATHGFDLILE